MPIYQCTMFFGQAETGWSETYWASAGSQSGFTTILQPVLNARASLLTDIHYILGVRVSEVGSARKSRVFTPGENAVDFQTFLNVPAAGMYPTPNAQTQWDQIRACGHLYWLNAGNLLGLRYLAGIPDITSKTEPDTIDITKPAQWWRNFRTWGTALTAGGFAIRTLDKGAGNPEQRINNWVTQVAAPQILGAQISSPPGILLNPGDKVQIRGVKMRASGLQSPNKLWVVDSSVTNAGLGIQTVYLRGALGIDPSDIKSLGYIRKVLYTYPAIETGQIRSVGIHKRGKPYGSPRGRTVRKVFAA